MDWPCFMIYSSQSNIKFKPRLRMSLALNRHCVCLLVGSFVGYLQFSATFIQQKWELGSFKSQLNCSSVHSCNNGFLKGILHQKNYYISSRKAQHLMIETTYSIFFENIFLHLYQNKCQNIRTPPLPSYRAPLHSQRATPALTSYTMVPLVSAGVALYECRGCPI